MTMPWEDGPLEVQLDTFEDRMRHGAPVTARVSESAYECQEIGDTLCNEGRVRDAIAHTAKLLSLKKTTPATILALGMLTRIRKCLCRR